MRLVITIDGVEGKKESFADRFEDFLLRKQRPRILAEKARGDLLEFINGYEDKKIIV